MHPLNRIRRDPQLLLALRLALVAAAGISSSRCGTGSSPSDASTVDAGSPDLLPPPHTSAPPRADLTFGYDSVSNRLIAFGGDDGPEVAGTLIPHYHDDTWLYDVASGNWSLSAAAGPSARGRTAFAMDTTNRRLLTTFGRTRAANATGNTPYTPLLDTWSFAVDTYSWTLLMPIGSPAGRSAPATVYDAARDRLVIFGGNLSFEFPILSGFNPTNETWQMVSGNAWSKVTTSGPTPPARYLAGSALDEKRQRMIVFGGCCDQMGNFYSDVWALDLASNTWSMLIAGEGDVSDRLGPGAAYDPVNDQLVIFAGHDLSDLGHVNDTWGLPLAGTPAWKNLGMGDQPDNTTLGCAGNASEEPYDFTKVDFTSPERRERPLFTHVGATLVLYGGEGDCAQLNDTWTFAANTWTKQIPATQGESCLRRGDQCTCLCE